MNLATSTYLSAKPTKFQKWLCIFAAAAIALMLCLTVVYGADTSTAIESGIKGGMSSIYNLIKSIVTPIACVCLAWNVFKALFGGQRGMEEAKKNILTIIIVIALVMLAPVVIEAVAAWFPSQAGSIFS
jgi:uncharacterized membrane protein YjjP (DUF1212 family)